jgi:hypothetical protein
VKSISSAGDIRSTITAPVMPITLTL